MNNSEIAQGRESDKEKKPSTANWLARHKAKLQALGLTDSPVLQRYRERQRAHSIKRSKPKIAARVKFIDDIKMSRGCADCGYAKHPAALDFDHLPGFTKTVAISVLRRQWSTSVSVLESEIAKCEVVCANCHRIRTAERKHWLSNPKNLAAWQSKLAPAPTQAAMTAFREKADWCRIICCSKCGEAGHNIRACPQGADSIRGIIFGALMVESKTLDEIVAQTKLKRSAANYALCAMAKKGIVNKSSRKNNGRWDICGRKNGASEAEQASVDRAPEQTVVLSG